MLWHHENLILMLILNLIVVQYLQNTIFSFEKGSICQYHSSSDFMAHTLFSTIWKTLATVKKEFISIKTIFLAFLFTALNYNDGRLYNFLKENRPSFSLDKWTQLKNWNFSRQAVTFNLSSTPLMKKIPQILKIIYQNTSRNSRSEENLWWNIVLILLKNYQNGYQNECHHGILPFVVWVPFLFLFKE